MKYSTNVPKRYVFYGYLKATNGLNNLSPQEMKVLGEFMWYHKQFIEKDAYSIPGVDIFSTETRKQIAEHLGLSQQNLTNLIGTIKKKGFIEEVGRKGLKIAAKFDAFVRDVIKTGKAIVTFEMVMVELPPKKVEVSNGQDDKKTEIPSSGGLHSGTAGEGGVQRTVGGSIPGDPDLPPVLHQPQRVHSEDDQNT